MRSLKSFGIAAAALFSVLAASSSPASANHEGSGAAEVKAMDANGDGKVSSAEHVAGAKAMFDAMDANHDSYVTAQEMDAYKAAKMAKTPEMGKEESAGTMKTSAEKIATLDTDKDGRLSASEHAEGSKAMFTKMDTNGDGFLVADEIQAGHDSMMKKPA